MSNTAINDSAQIYVIYIINIYGYINMFYRNRVVRGKWT